MVSPSIFKVNLILSTLPYIFYNLFHTKSVKMLNCSHFLYLGSPYQKKNIVRLEYFSLKQGIFDAVNSIFFKC